MAKKRGDRGAHYDALALVSGGPDSTTLLYHMKEEEGLNPLAFHFSTGLAPNDKELQMARKLLKEIDIPLQVVDISHFIAASGNDMPTIHSEAHALRFGTAVILSMASAFAIAHNMESVWLALHAEDAEEATEYTDEFIRYMNDGVKLIGEKCAIKAPFHKWKKSEIIQYGQALGAPLEKTWSCVSPIKGFQCGSCGACRARRKAFELAKVEDKTRYSLK